MAIPAGILTDVPHLREKTAKIGLLARGAAIFRIEEIIVYLDSRDGECGRMQGLICKVLDYVASPQYLRRMIFGQDPDLRFVGILPPLRTPNHPLVTRMANLMAGEYREGVVLSSGGGGAEVEIGVERPLKVKGTLRGGSRITARIIDPIGGIGEAVERDDVDIYWGYRTTAFRSSLGHLLRERRGATVVATSRFGRPVSEAWDDLSRHLKGSRGLLLLFGSPNEGVAAILAKENVNLEASAYAVVNTVPLQGTATVRTEEAVIASLAVFNLMIEGMKLGS